MAEGNYAEMSNNPSLHVKLPEYEAQYHSTIFKLTLSMKRRLSPQVTEVSAQPLPSPAGAGEVRDLLRRLVEIDAESREILCKVFALLEKDETLEKYVQKRIEDPKVSRMWELVEQVLACQEQDTNLNELIMGEDNSSNDSTYDRSIQDSDEIRDQETMNERFKVKNLANGSSSATTSAK
ncbi:hypothetical protein BVRB_7g160100 [Beta vulgaris subsp. vulgaris]|nr:hypothetical protein BVRB_7g160100 [Beta vulgaris subsp. vulgaris]